MIRKLEKNDYHKNFLQLLSQLTTTNTEISYLQFSKQFDKINSHNNIHVFVIEQDNKIIASGTVILEDKFIHSFKKVAHIEDIVVDKNYRNGKYGNKIINFLTTFAFENDCYKVILDCNKNITKFYEKCHFKENAVQMALYKPKL